MLQEKKFTSSYKLTIFYFPPMLGRLQHTPHGHISTTNVLKKNVKILKINGPVKLFPFFENLNIYFMWFLYGIYLETA